MWSMARLGAPATPVRASRTHGLFVPKADSECRLMPLGAVWAGQRAGWCRRWWTSARGFDAFLMPGSEVRAIPSTWRSPTSPHRGATDAVTARDLARLAPWRGLVALGEVDGMAPINALSLTSLHTSVRAAAIREHRDECLAWPRRSDHRRNNCFDRAISHDALKSKPRDS